MSDLTRREFVGVAAAALALPALGQEEPEPIRIGICGCGGRGTGATANCLGSSRNVKLVAMADLYEDRLARSRDILTKRGHAVEDKNCFFGFDAYKRMLETDIDLALFATPPGFRPMQVEAAIHANKHVFMEKPVAVDPVGVRRVIATGEEAKKKGLAMVAGTQYRHQQSFMESVAEIHAGRIGDVLSGRIYYNTGPIWVRTRKKGMSDMEWQTRNWYYFTWLSGDHIVEQHVHTIDVMNWVLNGPPVRALAMGGRLVRTGEKHGNIYDHFAVDYEFKGGRHVMSMCRQMRGADPRGGAHFVGAKGRAAVYSGRVGTWKFEGKSSLGMAYVQEHTDLIASIRAGKPLNEARQVAESTLTAIMGRQAAYTGKVIKWDDLMKSDLDLSPPKYEMGPLAVRPVPRPGL